MIAGESLGPGHARPLRRAYGRGWAEPGSAAEELRGGAANRLL